MKKIGLVLAVILVLGLSALNLKDMFSGIKLPGGEKTRVVLETMSGYDTAYAQASTSITITVTCRYLSLSLSRIAWAIGTIDVDNVRLSSDATPIGGAIVVTNNGNAIESFAVRVTNPINWTVGATTGANIFRLTALFRAVAPTEGLFEANDNLTITNQTATADIFAIAGDAIGEKGYSVTNGTTRNLWLRFQAPASLTAAHAEQSIVVTLTAVTP